MLPKKILWLLGQSSLATILEQDRKHWLLKTDKNKQVQDRNTGDIFRGQIDNIGTDIMIETRKELEGNLNILKMKFEDDGLNHIFESDYASFPYSAGINGFMASKITSINYPTENENTVKHYRLQFTNYREITLLFASSADSADVIKTRWIYTDKIPNLMVMDQDGNYTIAVSLKFNENITNVRYFYPLTESLQPFGLTKLDDDSYVTSAINQEEYIGYPLFWFTCDQSKIGPHARFSTTNEYRIGASQYSIFALGNEGNASKYESKLYTLFDGELATPDHTSYEDYEIYVQPKEGNKFTHTTTDFDVFLDTTLILKNKNSISDEDIKINLIEETLNDITCITMDSDAPWEYVDKSNYKIEMGAFVDNIENYPLTPLATVKFNTRIPFTTTNESQLGFAGIRSSSSNLVSDVYGDYPHDLNKWDGLPEWLQNLDENSVQQHMAIYALHNTPWYVPDEPETRQTAALLLDPGGKDANGYAFDMIWRSDDRFNTFGFDDGPVGVRFIRRSKNICKGILGLNEIIDAAVKGYDEDDNLVFVGYMYIGTGSYFSIIDLHSWQEDRNDCIGGAGRIYPIHWYGDPDKEKFVITRMAATKISYSANNAYDRDEEYTVNDIGVRMELYRIKNLDRKGRVYVLSNDDTEYANNATATEKKPDRTVARICDIPTSVMQLSNIKGVAPTNIVDPKYVRTEIGFTESDKDRLYNKLTSRWVRPTALDINGVAIVNGYPIQNGNTIVFQSEEMLNLVDLVNHNDFREYTNLNPQVKPEDVTVASIATPGSGYDIGDIGLIVVGGFSFEYHVTSLTPIDNGVAEVEIHPSSETIKKISISNFDMLNNATGITDPYGTSRISGSGTGLKIRLFIPDYQDMLLKKGELFDGLFALCKCADGIYLYQYQIDRSLHITPHLGLWQRLDKISDTEDSITNKEDGSISTTDAIINATLPILRTLPVAQPIGDDEFKTPITSLQVYTTPSFVNVIDQTKTPVHDAELSTENTSLTEVDLCSFYCTGIHTLTASEKTLDGVINALKDHHTDYYDDILIWKWFSSDYRDRVFHYAHIRRSFNNLLSTDTMSLLPSNQLQHDNYVNSNPGTTIVWDVKGVGPMMWAYNPTYTKYEKYIIDSETRDLKVVRTSFDWSNVKIYWDVPNVGGYLKLVNDKGVFTWNVLTNAMVYTDNNAYANDQPIYQQPEYTQYPDLLMGKSAGAATHKLCGNWQLIYPRINEFTLSHITDGRTFTPMKMQIIRGDHLDDSGNVVDGDGHIVNHKTLVISDTVSEINLKLYNTESGQWQNITKKST